MTPEFCVFYGVLTFLWIEFFWKQYLTLRQRRVYKTTETVPEKLTDVIDIETFRKAKSYGIDKNSFSIVEACFNIVFLTGFICLNGLTLMWNFSQFCLAETQYENNELMISSVFVLLMNTLGALMYLPFLAYQTFIIEEQHGFNKQNFSFFVMDKTRNFLLLQALSLPITIIGISIVNWSGRCFFIWLWVFIAVTSLILITIFPVFIAPLMDKYTPLSDSPLKTKIEELAKKVNFPLLKIYIVEGSKRSTHSNAYFYGFFKSQRIVLFDTLLKDNYDTTVNQIVGEENRNMNDDKIDGKGKGMNDEEILAILCHELGHWKLNHVLFNIILYQINSLTMLFIFGYLFNNSTLYRAFGFYESKHPFIIGLSIVFQYVFSPYNTVILFVMTTISRQFEFQADDFAKKHGKGKALESGLIKLNNDNLGFPVYDSLYSTWHHNNPQLLERLEAIAKTD